MLLLFSKQLLTLFGHLEQILPNEKLQCPIRVVEDKLQQIAILCCNDVGSPVLVKVSCFLMVFAFWGVIDQL